MNEIVKYAAPDNKLVIEVRFDNDTLWLTQKQIAEMFQTPPKTSRFI